MDRNIQIIGAFASVVILAMAIFFAGSQIGGGLENFRNYDRYVTMKGLAEQEVTADLAIWPLSYTETGNDLTTLQNLMDERGKIILAFLKRHGLQNDEIKLQQVNVQDLMAQSYRQNNAMVNRYILTQSYLVRTENIEAVSIAAKKLGDLIRQGVVFAQNGSTAPTYLYTKLNDVKPEMIAQATKNAREAAQEFAEHSDSDVGNIKYASQGVFQILPRDATYTVPEAQQINKKVRVVSTIQFYLED
jgi:hypothetical protein